jgi:hypothetical protein
MSSVSNVDASVLGASYPLTSFTRLITPRSESSDSPACGIFVTRSAKSRNFSQFNRWAPANGGRFLKPFLLERWLEFCPLNGEDHVFRTALFSIVLSLAVGQNASLLCKTLCDPAAAAGNGCHDHSGRSGSSVTLTGGHHCDSDAPLVTAYVKENVRRSAPAPQTVSSLPIARYLAVSTMVALHPNHGPGRLPSLEKRPLDTALRI